MKKFPRNSDGVLKVSQATRDRAQAWLKKNRFEEGTSYKHVELDVYAVLNERLDFDDFRTMGQIVDGFSTLERQKISSNMVNFIARGSIEKVGKAGRYKYRLVKLLVRERKARNQPALALMPNEVARRYSA